jgi:RNA polymerase subunit RPABC4/transcription elongation factor Spt4
MYRNIRDMKDDLSHVFWISGGPCGGKTTAAKILSKDFAFTHYNCDDHRIEHFKRATPDKHPTMCQKLVWEEFFKLSVDDSMVFWRNYCQERCEMIVEDLYVLPKDILILVDGVYATPEWLMQAGSPQKAVFMFAKEGFLRRNYYNRESTRWMRGIFSKCSNPEQAQENWIHTTLMIDRDRLESAKRFGFQVIIVDEKSCITDSVEIIKRHFGLYF